MFKVSYSVLCNIVFRTLSELSKNILILLIIHNKQQ
jgi:hypothetical protein